MIPPVYDFYAKLAQTINSGTSRSLLLYGNTGDLFYQGDEKEGKYVPLVPYLNEKWCNISDVIQVVIELNGPLTLINPQESNLDPKATLRAAWHAWKAANNPNLAMGDGYKEFEDNINSSNGNSAFAIEFMRQVTMAVRWARHKMPGFRSRLIIIVESAEMQVPAGNGDISQLQPLDRRKVAILEDWFSDPEFYEGSDTAILVSQSKSQMHPRVTQMPQLFEIEVPSPNVLQRQHYIEWISNKVDIDDGADPTGWYSEPIAKQTAGLSLQALRQLLIESAYRHPGKAVPPDLIIEEVEQFIQQQIGEDVVEFKKPSHNLDDVIGFSHLKNFIRTKLIPRIKKGGKGALSAFAVAGPIGVGKTFIFEAMANEMDMPVIVLKSIRSKWFGETDAIFEKLRRVLEAIGQCLVFVDEADTQFGGLGEGTHETERRLTGKIQAMMSDTKLKGQVVWLLMTARIDQLSPDMRRQGRAGDLIIPVLDPYYADPFTTDAQGRRSNDFYEFVRWIISAVLKNRDSTDNEEYAIGEKMRGRSAAAFAMIRSLAISEEIDNLESLIALIDDVLEPDIKDVRRRQELLALLNCTRLSLLPTEKDTYKTIDVRKDIWRKELQKLG